MSIKRCNCFCYWVKVRALYCLWTFNGCCVCLISCLEQYYLLIYNWRRIGAEKMDPERIWSVCHTCAAWEMLLFRLQWNLTDWLEWILFALERALLRFHVRWNPSPTDLCDRRHSRFAPMRLHKEVMLKKKQDPFQARHMTQAWRKGACQWNSAPGCASSELLLDFQTVCPNEPVSSWPLSNSRSPLTPNEIIRKWSHYLSFSCDDVSLW